MEVHYCDFCGSPIKNAKFWLIIFEAKEEVYGSYDNPQEYYNNMSRYINCKKDIKEICSKCHKIVRDLFEYRFTNLNKLCEEIRNIYELADKLPKKIKHKK